MYRKISTLGLGLLLAGQPMAAHAAIRSIIGAEDGRAPITAIGPELGLTPQEIEQARNATGYLMCPGTEHGNAALGAAALVEGARTLVAAGHSFVDDQGRPRLPFEECTFTNQAEFSVTVSVDAGQGGLYLGADDVVPPGHPRDFAVARLSQPIAGARPYPVYEGTAPADLIGIELIVVTAFQPGVAESDLLVPLVQRCSIREVRAARALDPQVPAGEASGAYVVYTDCDAERLASGSVMLTRVDGELHAVAVLVSTGRSALDGKDYGLATGSYTAGVLLSGDLRDAVLAMAAEPALANRVAVL
jgi:hypothetical protein